MTDMIWSFAPWMAFLIGVRVGNVYIGAGIGAPFWPSSIRATSGPGVAMPKPSPTGPSA
jgi:hypothetical protein